MWQDYLIAGVIMMFVLTTIPLITSNVTMPVGTSLPMTLGSILLAIAYFTLSLYFALSVEVVSTVLWMILLHRTFKHQGKHVRS